MQDKRPSDRELSKRLNQAKEFLENRHGLFANPSKAMGELIMYVKFVLKNERYYYVSLHQSRSAEQKGED